MDLSESFQQFVQKLTKRNTLTLSLSIIGILAFIFGTTQFYYFKDPESLKASMGAPQKEVAISSFPIKVPTIKYGFAIDTFQLFEHKIRNREFLADILLRQQVDYMSIEQIVQNAKDVFDVRHLRAGKSYTILTKDSTQRADYFIYEPNAYEYIVFHLQDDLKVERIEREVTTVNQTASGIIESSLWNTMIDNGLSFELTAKMEDALQWSIDFHHIQKEDQFKVVYEENLIDGEPVGVGKVEAAYYKTGENDYYAIYFDNGKDAGYYDLQGRPMNKGFLKSPVKYSRISSYFNLNRFHPILKRRRPHFGTDYAAPYGTPIYAVGDGVVTKASYTKGNGNFVKIRHNDTYETQYLHMQKFANGIGSGVHVKQGQVIGYVGSTGLATGPHVCFRFWKNGGQVNHLNLTFPPPAPLPAEDMPAFNEIKDHYLSQINGIHFRELTKEEEVQTSANVEERSQPAGNP